MFNVEKWLIFFCPHCTLKGKVDKIWRWEKEDFFSRVNSSTPRFNSETIFKFLLQFPNTIFQDGCKILSWSCELQRRKHGLFEKLEVLFLFVSILPCSRTKYEKKWKCQLLSHVQLSATPWTVARLAPLFMEFPRQEYWSGLPFPSQGTFPTQRQNPGLLQYRQILHHLSHRGVPWAIYTLYKLIY